MFTEHLSIDDDAARGPVLRIKHFNPGMKGWEEKDESVVCNLERLEFGDVQWVHEANGKRMTLRYRTVSPGTIECTLVHTEGDKRDETVFKLTTRDRQFINLSR